MNTEKHSNLEKLLREKPSEQLPASFAKSFVQNHKELITKKVTAGDNRAYGWAWLLPIFAIFGAFGYLLYTLPQLRQAFVTDLDFDLGLELGSLFSGLIETLHFDLGTNSLQLVGIEQISPLSLASFALSIGILLLWNSRKAAEFLASILPKSNS